MDESKIILPTKKIRPTPIIQEEKENRNELKKNGVSRIEEELAKKPEESEAYLPDNTKYYLNTIVQGISPLLSQAQILELVKIMCDTFDCVECIKQEHKGNHIQRNKFLLTEFVNTKIAESCSKKTVQYYRSTLVTFFKRMQKHAEDITTEDIEKYFLEGMTKEKPWSPTTQDNVRRILNTFYVWAVSRRYIIYNPVSPIKPTKNKKYRVKKPFTNEDIIKLRDAADVLRDRAMMELLLCSGIRVAELVNLNIEDIDFINKEFTVIGKGDKQRYAYFTEQAGYYLQKYLASRKDNNPALFVTLNSPYKRFGITGVEIRIRELGEEAGVTGKSHPHRFRHTFATMALNKGIPIEQVQKLLGHEQLDTTLIYAKVAREDVKYNHKKLMN